MIKIKYEINRAKFSRIWPLAERQNAKIRIKVLRDNNVTVKVKDNLGEVS